MVDLSAYSPPDERGFSDVCGVRLMVTPGTSPTDLAEGVVAMMEEQSQGVLLDSPRSRVRELGSGSVAAQVDMDMESLDGRRFQSTLWLVASDPWAAIVSCQGVARPADAWLSIAETFEFSPVVE